MLPHIELLHVCIDIAVLLVARHDLPDIAHPLIGVTIIEVQQGYANIVIFKIHQRKDKKYNN